MPLLTELRIISARIGYKHLAPNGAKHVSRPAMFFVKGVRVRRIAGQLTEEKVSKDAGRCSLPTWHELSELHQEDSKRFQDYANEMAADKKFSRVHLDIGLWVKNRKQ